MKVALSYAHAASNWGDLAINKGVVNLLKHSHVDLNDVHALRLPHNMIHSLNSDLSLEHLKVIPVESSASTDSSVDKFESAFEYLTNIESYIADFSLDKVDVIMLNAGEHIFETPDGSNHGDLAWRMLPLIAGAHAGVPVVQLPSTFGPFYTQKVSRLVSHFFESLSVGAVRDELSSAIVHNYGGGSFESVLDPGFFGVEDLPEESPQESGGAVALIPRLEDFGLRAGSRRSTFVLTKNRNARYKTSKAFEVYFHLALEILSTSSESVHLVIQTAADRELIQNLYAALATGSHADRVWLHDPTDYETFLQCLADMSIVVTSRFHAGILALTQGIPAVGIFSESHGHKMPGMFSMLDSPRSVVRLQDRTKEEVVRDITEAMHYSRKNKAEIYESVVSWREYSRSWFERALDGHLNNSSLGIDLGKIDQMRIDWLNLLHKQIKETMQNEGYQGVLQQLKKIEGRLPSR